jgi:hypothetical protein
VRGKLKLNAERIYKTDLEMESIFKEIGKIKDTHMEDCSD